MDDNSLLEWLVTNSGPALKLRMLNKSMIEKDTFPVDELVDQLLEIEKVKNSLSYFDAFRNYKTMACRELWALVHNCYENCFEQFMPFLLDIGFRKGITVFDEKVEIMRKVYPYLMDTYPFHGIIIMLNLLRAGYCYEDITYYVTDRVDQLHIAAIKQAFDIYEKDKGKVRQPSKWKDFLILKDEYVTETQLPVIYDVELILFFIKYIENADVEKKVYDIIAYINDPRYQSLAGDYGWHWAEGAKTYHASSSGIHLPLYNKSELTGSQQYHFLNLLDRMSYSEAMCKAKWFHNCIEYLEQYKTERNTYLLPEELIHPSKMNTFYSLYVSKEALKSVKRNEKKSFALELYSTFYVLLIKHRMKQV